MERIRRVAKWLISVLVLILFIALSPILVPLVLWFAMSHGSTAGEAELTVE